MLNNAAKRLIDIGVSMIGLLLLSPLLLLAAILVKMSSTGPIFFRQERIGRNFRPFRILKFRTMIQDAPSLGRSITVGNDPRITSVGRWLRKTKIDELPQLLNVFMGDMSLVGPRPEVRRYVELFANDYAEVLSVRPGITDLASIQFRHESELLGKAADPDAEYCKHILPEKIRLAKEYIRRSSIGFDLLVILRTLLVLTRMSEAK